MKVIYLSAAILVFSFVVMPIMNGVSTERNDILASNAVTEATPSDDSISFEEMYALFEQDEFSPESLNAITPAAGESASFPSGFSGVSDAALTDTPVLTPETDIPSEGALN